MSLPQTEHELFRLRGVHTTRIETLTDAAFAFAFTLLVIGQGKIPADFTELVQALKHIPAFIASMALLATFWYRHHQWSRRTGLEDVPSVALSFMLVLLVLIYVYPLKAVFSSLFYWLSGYRLPSGIQLQSDADLSGLFMVYSLGYLAMCLCLWLLNRHALKVKLPLPLNDYERTVLQNEMRVGVVLMSVACASVLIALTATGYWILAGGFIYGSLVIIMPITAWFNRRRLRLIQQASST